MADEIHGAGESSPGQCQCHTERNIQKAKYWGKNTAQHMATPAMPVAQPTTARVRNKNKKRDGKLRAAEGSNSDEDTTVMDSNDVYATESIGAVRTKGNKWFVNLRLNGKLQRCQLDSGATCNAMSLRDRMRLAPREKLKASGTILKLYSDQGLPSLVFTTECAVRSSKYKLDFEVVDTRQFPLLSGSTAEEMGLNIVDNSLTSITKSAVIRAS